MSINLLSSGVIPLAVESVATSSLNVSGASSLMGTSFNDQALSGVLSLSGGDSGGLLISSTVQNLNLSSANGSVRLSAPLGAITLSQSANRSGTVTANNTAGIVTSTTALSANSVILLTVKTASGTNAGSAYVSAVVSGTSFTIKNANVDQSVYNWLILN